MKQIILIGIFASAVLQACFTNENESEEQNVSSSGELKNVKGEAFIFDGYDPTADLIKWDSLQEPTELSSDAIPTNMPLAKIKPWQTHPFYVCADKGNIILEDARLWAGECLLSDNGYYLLLMQTDGNLVAYRNWDGTPYWHTHTNGTLADFAYMGTNGNFWLGYSGYIPYPVYWNSYTLGKYGYHPFLAMQDDNNIVIYWDGGAYGLYR